MPKSPHVLIAGGGSLGCVYPGLSIARQLRSRLPGARLTIAGDGRAVERHAVRAAGLRYATVPSSDRPRRLVDTPGYLARAAAGWCVAQWLLRELEVDLVVSIGGTASGPTVRAARSCGVPYVLLEQDTLPCPATRDFAAGAFAVCLTHEETEAGLPIGSATRVTGAVGRPGFEDAFGQRPGERRPAVADEGRPRLIVLGGAGGATSLNQSAPEALRLLGADAHGWQVVHQSGDGWLTATQRLYSDAGVDAVVVSYIDELANLARAADLVVCRPGGSTLAELALAGLPAVLAPDSRRGDQLHESNARYAAVQHGCAVVDEPLEADGLAELSARLAAGLRPLMTDARARERVSERLTRAASPEASSRVADTCLEGLGVAAAPTATARPLVRQAA